MDFDKIEMQLMSAKNFNKIMLMLLINIIKVFAAALFRAMNAGKVSVCEQLAALVR